MKLSTAQEIVRIAKRIAALEEVRNRFHTKIRDAAVPTLLIEFSEPDSFGDLGEIVNALLKDTTPLALQHVNDKIASLKSTLVELGVDEQDA